MDSQFAATIADWNGFFTFAGGAAATLLGLLFVAVSLRLDIFSRQEIADVRDFAALTFACFLSALAVAGLALAPHQHGPTLALPLLLFGTVGLIGFAILARDWRRLNPSAPGRDPRQPREWPVIVALASPFAGLVVVAGLLWRDQGEALAGLAIVEGGLLAIATVNAWVMLSRAGSDLNSSPPAPAADDATSVPPSGNAGTDHAHSPQ